MSTAAARKIDLEFLHTLTLTRLITSCVGHSEFTPSDQYTTMTMKNKGKRKASANSSAEHVTFCQSNLALNPPSIYFDKPKKSTEKSDDEGNY
jgi:hypothetical protein